VLRYFVPRNDPRVVHYRQRFGGKDLKASVLFRIASVLLLLFAVGHTLGFRKVDPKWGAESLVASMQSVHFEAQGFQRSYWDFYTGFGLFESVFLLFSAVLAWQLDRILAKSLPGVRGVAWALAVCFLAVSILSWRYFFIAPVVFSILIAICLIAAAWLSGKPVVA